jgi:hypothetical protein
VTTSKAPCPFVPCRCCAYYAPTLEHVVRFFASLTPGQLLQISHVLSTAQVRAFADAAHAVGAWKAACRESRDRTLDVD